MPEIKILSNGPLFVQGDEVTLVDAEGQAIEPPRRPYALCRCGGSANKPFCDGSHKSNSFDGTLNCPVPS